MDFPVFDNKEEAKPQGSNFEPSEALANKPTESVSSTDPIWESFLKEVLPVIGSVYSGDISSSAKKLEASLGAQIGKSLNGVIWNDTKKQFNTTPDDIRKALNLLAAHQASQSKAAKYTLDQRFLAMSQILLDSQ